LVGEVDGLPVGTEAGAELGALEKIGETDASFAPAFGEAALGMRLAAVLGAKVGAVLSTKVGSKPIVGESVTESTRVGSDVGEAGVGVRSGELTQDKGGSFDS